MKEMMSRFVEVIAGRDADETSEVIKSPVRFDRDGGVPIEL
jgi:hypothetical protein